MYIYVCVCIVIYIVFALIHALICVFFGTVDHHLNFNKICKRFIYIFK